MKRSFLTAMSLEKEVIDQIMAEHGATIETLKEKAKEDAEKQTEKLQLKIDALQKTIDDSPEVDGDLKTKYDKLKGEFDTYKMEIETKETTKAQDKALFAALEAAGAHEKAIPLIIKEIDRTKTTFDGDIEKGFTIKNGDEVLAPVKEAYGDFFGEVKTEGAGVHQHSTGFGGGGETKSLSESNKSLNAHRLVK